MVLDFTLTLILNHTILTTYYASSFPTSLFFWAIMGGSALLIIIFAEQLCVRREMREGLKAITARRAGDDHTSKASSSSSRNPQRRQSMTPHRSLHSTTHQISLSWNTAYRAIHIYYLGIARIHAFRHTCRNTHIRPHFHHTST